MTRQTPDKADPIQDRPLTKQTCQYRATAPLIVFAGADPVELRSNTNSLAVRQHLVGNGVGRKKSETFFSL
jgi:hypothetical protein